MYHYRIGLIINSSNGLQTRTTLWLSLATPYDKEIESAMLENSDKQSPIDSVTSFYTLVEEVTYLGFYAP
jgi:hypothetical protein